MATESSSAGRRPRISIDVDPEMRRRLRLAAAQHDLTVRQYVLETIEERLRQDIGADPAQVMALSTAADPLLGELWDNERDAAYDRL